MSGRIRHQTGLDEETTDMSSSFTLGVAICTVMAVAVPVTTAVVHGMFHLMGW